MYQFDWSSILPSMPYLIAGLGVTFKIMGTAVVVGILLGTALAVMRLSSSKLLSAFSAAYVNTFRAIPLVMVLLWFFLIVPQFLEKALGLTRGTDTRLVSACVAFALFQAAYFAEVVRAGIQSVSKGQMQAAKALGMTYLQAMRLVVLPQAFKNMVPLLLTQTVVLLQDTSLVYVSSLADFFGVASKVGERDGRTVEMILFAGAVYFVVCFAMSQLVRYSQNRQKTA